MHISKPNPNPNLNPNSNRYLVQHRMVDVITSTAGGIEEDFIKCLGKTYSGDFKLKVI